MPAKSKKPTPRPKSRLAASAPVKSASKSGKASKAPAHSAKAKVVATKASLAPKSRLTAKAKPAKVAPKKVVKPASKAVSKSPAATKAPKLIKIAVKLPAKGSVKPVKGSAKIAKPVVAKSKSASRVSAKTLAKPTPKSVAKKIVKAIVKPVAKPASKVAVKPSNVPAKKAALPLKSSKASAPVVLAKKALSAKVVQIPKTSKAGKPTPVAPKAEPAKKLPVEKVAKVVKVVAEPKAKAAKLEYFKGGFFQEVAPGSTAVRKTRAPQVPVVSLKKPKGEESHDELIARIERELLTVRMTSRKVQRAQLCTKCCINPVDPSYMVDRDTGYCPECAIVLGLGHTREARQQNFHPSLMKSEDEEPVEA